MAKQFEVGLKMETDVINWCIADGLDIVKFHGRECIASRYFSKAQTNAETRRLQKQARNCLSKKKERRSILNTIFYDEICHNRIDESLSDPLFFKRLKMADSIFPTIEETKAFWKKYPTIFNLVDHLMNVPEADVRLIYIALKDMMDHRGSFETMISSDGTDEKVSFTDLFETMNDKVKGIGIDIRLSDAEIATVEKILTSSTNKKNKKADLESLFHMTKKDKDILAIINLLNGSNAELKSIFPDTLEDLDKKESKFNFTNDYTTERARISEYLSEGELEILDSLRGLYDFLIIEKVLGNEQSYYSAKAKSYSCHEADRLLLMEILQTAKQYEGCNRMYFEMFENKASDKPNYCRYVKKGLTEKSKRKTPSVEDFYAFVQAQFNVIKNELNNSPNAELLEKIEFCERNIENGIFMPKQRVSENTYMPNSIIRLDMIRLLNCQKEMHPWLFEESKHYNSGLTCADELLAYFSFKIPFWMGPLSPDKKGAWVVRKENGTVYPWNIKDKIDFAETRKAYISKMTDNCQLLIEDNVLPNSSYYIQKTEVLNELSRVTVNGCKIPPEFKKIIFNSLFLTKNTVTKKDVLEFLKDENWDVLDDIDSADTTGFVKEKLVHSMSAFLTAKKILPEITVDDYEEIARYVAVFNDEKRIALECLSDILDISNDVLKKLINAIPHTGWGAYGKKALVEVEGGKRCDEEKKSIIQTLETSTDTLNTILGPDYTFIDSFWSKNKKILETISDSQFIDAITNNPVLRRSMHQTANILYDIKKAYGDEGIRTIYVNMYLPSNERAVTISALRKKLLVVLKKLKKKELADLLDSMKVINMRQYLWFSQLGVDMYTGEAIPFSELNLTDKWTVDHIYPKSKVYDNTYNNLCLTHTNVNDEKKNIYPIDSIIQEKMEDYWNKLLENELITSAKYDALVSKYFDIEKAYETINKILIEKRIMALEFESLINRIFPKAKVVHVNKKLLHDFKKMSPHFLYHNGVVFENDGALDAYYTLLVGRTWHHIFGDNPKEFVKNNKNYTLNVYNLDTEVWNSKESLKKVENVINSARPRQTQMVDSNVNGQLYDEQIISSRQAIKSDRRKAPIKEWKQDTNRYGGFLSLKTGYFALVKHDGIVSLEPVKIVDMPNIKGEDGLKELFESFGFKNVEILQEKIGRYTPLEINGNLCYITSSEQGRIRYWNATPYWMKNNEMRLYLLKIGFLKERTNNYDSYEIAKCNRPELKDISFEKNMAVFKELCHELQQTYSSRTNGVNAMDKVMEKEAEFRKLDVYEQCKVLTNLTDFSNRKMMGCDLRTIGLAKLFGIDTMSAKFKHGDKIVIKSQSPTGFFYKETIIQN